MFKTDTVINSRKPLKDTTTSKFPWVAHWKMADGEFDFKLLAHSEKCPDGYRMYTVHQFENEPGDEWKDMPKFLCSESTRGIDEETGRLLKPCCACDVVEDIRSFKDGKFYENELEPEYQKIIFNLSANRSRSLLFPMLIYARVVHSENSKGVKTTNFVPDKNSLMGGIFELKVGGDKKDKDVYEQIYAIHEKEGDHLFDPNGVWLHYSKQGKTRRITAKRARALDEAEKKLYKHYPDIVNLGKGVATEGNFNRPSLDIPYSKQRAMLKKSWWGQGLADEYGYDFDDPELQGLACRMSDSADEEE